MTAVVGMWSVCVATLLSCWMATEAKAQVCYYPSQPSIAYNSYYTSYYPTTAQPQVSYAPQAVWRQVPVTSYQQVATMDAFTGQQVVAMRPITTWQWQLQQAPVLGQPTSYMGANTPVTTRANGSDNSAALQIVTEKLGQIDSQISILVAEKSRLEDRISKLEQKPR